MQDTSSQTLRRNGIAPEQKPRQKTAGSWTEAEREEILCEHPEVETDNIAFIRELLRRHAVGKKRHS